LPHITWLALILIGWYLSVMARMFYAGLFPGKQYFSPPYLLGHLTEWIAFGGFSYLGVAALHEGGGHIAILNTILIGILWVLFLIVGGRPINFYKAHLLGEGFFPNRL
jgi:hypothetical protein